MASKFGWVDFAEDDQQQMMDVVKLFRQRGTMDELGLGTVRDAFGEYFFPGFTTIQTRARYFFFVPWIYQEQEDWLDRRPRTVEDVNDRIRGQEVDLIEALVEGSEVETGIIGASSGSELQRMPSTIYWSGLGTFGIRLYPRSKSNYHRRLSIRSRDDSGKEDGLLAGERTETGMDSPSPDWHPPLPEPPEDFLDETTLELREDEARYLGDRVLEEKSNSLLAALIIHEPGTLDVDFPWELDCMGTLPSPLPKLIKHAERFTLCIHGAQLMYNLMLAEKKPEAENPDTYRDRIADWSDELEPRWDELKNWMRNLRDFWHCRAVVQAGVPYHTVNFIEKWMERLSGKNPPIDIIDDEQARDYIRNREIHLKGWKRARLESPEALSRWSGESGTARLDYRWSIGSNILSDIHDGLAKEGERNNA